MRGSLGLVEIFVESRIRLSREVEVFLTGRRGIDPIAMMVGDVSQKIDNFVDVGGG